MLKTNKEKNVCKKYSKKQANGKVRCDECPLLKGNPNEYDFRCKANSSYNRKTKQWEYDEV